MIEGKKIVDFHTCDFFPERWFHVIVVLRAATEHLYDRLVARGYSEKKRTENIEAEIMNVVIDEARESYRPEIVLELSSNSVDEMDHNVERCGLHACNHLRRHAPTHMPTDETRPPSFKALYPHPSTPAPADAAQSPTLRLPPHPRACGRMKRGTMHNPSNFLHWVSVGEQPQRSHTLYSVF